MGLVKIFRLEYQKLIEQLSSPNFVLFTLFASDDVEGQVYYINVVQLITDNSSC